jgi:hypothetical protein
MKKVFFAAAVLLALVLFFFFRANDPARERMRGRERIEKEIQTCQDSLKFYYDKFWCKSDDGKKLFICPVFFDTTAKFPISDLMSGKRKVSDSYTSEGAFLDSRINFYRSRLDSLKRVLEGIPDD